jgi:DNA polymerase-3 subunit gamma/tau
MEQGLKILLEAHRSIRYSVSPRFELETVLVDLCALTKWVSQDDLRTAIEGVRSLFSVKTNGAQNAVVNSRRQVEVKAGNGAEVSMTLSGVPAATERGNESAERSFTDEFKRRIAARENSGAIQQVESRNPNENRDGIMAPEIELVEKVFQATVVNGND